MIYNNIGLVQQKLQDYTSALQSHQRALEIFRKTLGDNNPVTAAEYCNVANTQRKLGDYTSAIQSQQRALEIRRERLGDNHPETVESYRRLKAAIKGAKRYDAKGFNSHQLVLKNRHARHMHDKPDKAFSYKDSEISEKTLERHASHQRAQVRRKISGKKHPESSTTSHKSGFIKCVLAILLILLILSCSILTGSEYRLV